MSNHTALVNAILLEFGAREGLRIWKANTGGARNPLTGGLVKFGVPGQADISGIRLPAGRRIEIEAKTGRGKQSKAQLRWQAMIEKHNGVYILARSVEDVERVLG